MSIPLNDALIKKWVHKENEDSGNICTAGKITWVDDERNLGKLTGIQKIQILVPTSEGQSEVQEYEIKIHNVSNKSKTKKKALQRLEEQLKKMSTLAVLHDLSSSNKKIICKKGSYAKSWKSGKNRSKFKLIKSDLNALQIKERKDTINSHFDKSEEWKTRKLDSVKMALIVDKYVRPERFNECSKESSSSNTNEALLSTESESSKTSPNEFNTSSSENSYQNTEELSQSSHESAAETTSSDDSDVENSHVELHQDPAFSSNPRENVESSKPSENSGTSYQNAEKVSQSAHEPFAETTSSDGLFDDSDVENSHSKQHEDPVFSSNPDENVESSKPYENSGASYQNAEKVSQSAHESFAETTSSDAFPDHFNVENNHVEQHEDPVSLSNPDENVESSKLSENSGASYQNVEKISQSAHESFAETTSSDVFPDHFNVENNHVEQHEDPVSLSSFHQYRKFRESSESSNASKMGNEATDSSEVIHRSSDTTSLSNSHESMDFKEEPFAPTNPVRRRNFFAAKQEISENPLFPKPSQLETLEDAASFAFKLEELASKTNNFKNVEITVEDLDNVLRAEEIFEKQESIRGQNRIAYKDLQDVKRQLKNLGYFSVESSKEETSISSRDDSSYNNTYDSSQSETGQIIANKQNGSSPINSLEEATVLVLMTMLHKVDKEGKIRLSSNDIENLLKAKQIFESQEQLEETELHAYRDLLRILKIANEYEESSEESSSESSEMSSSSSFEMEIQATSVLQQKETKNESSMSSSDDDSDADVSNSGSDKRERKIEDTSSSDEDSFVLHPVLVPKQRVANKNSLGTLQSSKLSKLNLEEKKVIKEIANNSGGPLQRRLRICKEDIANLESNNTRLKQRVLDKYRRILKNPHRANIENLGVLALNHYKEKRVKILKEMIDVGYCLYNNYQMREAQTLIKDAIKELFELKKTQENLKNKNNRASAEEAIKALKAKGFLISSGPQKKLKVVLSYTEAATGLKNPNYANLNRVSPPFQYDFENNIEGMLFKEINFRRK